MSRLCFIIFIFCICINTAEAGSSIYPENGHYRTVGRLTLLKTGLQLVVFGHTPNQVALTVLPPSDKKKMVQWVGSVGALINRTVAIDGIIKVGKDYDIATLYADHIKGLAEDPLQFSVKNGFFSVP